MWIHMSRAFPRPSPKESRWRGTALRVLPTRLGAAEQGGVSWQIGEPLFFHGFSSCVGSLTVRGWSAQGASPVRVGKTAQALQAPSQPGFSSRNPSRSSQLALFNTPWAGQV